MTTFSVILAAAGMSRRFNSADLKKPFVTIEGKPVWVYSAELFRQREDVDQLLIVIAPDDRDWFEKTFAHEIEHLKVQVIEGGVERSDSVENGLRHVSSASDFVAIHDAARPCITAEMIDLVFRAAQVSLAAIPASSVNSTIKRSGDGRTVDETVERSGLYLAQTPQVFAREMLLDMFSKRAGRQPTDEAQLAEWTGQSVAIVAGSPLNIKITTTDDVAFVAACLQMWRGEGRVTFDATPDPTERTFYR